MGLISGLLDFGINLASAKAIHDMEAGSGEAYQTGFDDGKSGQPRKSFDARRKMEASSRRMRNPNEATKAVDAAFERLMAAYDEGYQDGQNAK